MFHTKVKQKNLFNVTLGIRGTRVKQTCRTNFEGLLQEKHVCECVPSHLHIQYDLLGQLGENRKLEIFSVGIRWKNANHSKQNIAKLPADLLKCQCSLGSLETELRTGLAVQAVGREPGDPGCIPGPATNPACDAGKSLSPKVSKNWFHAYTSGHLAWDSVSPHSQDFKVKPQVLTSHPCRRHVLGLSFITDATGLKSAKQPKMLRSCWYYMIT